MAHRRITSALLLAALSGCAPSVTIADGTSDAGEGGGSGAGGTSGSAGNGGQVGKGGVSSGGMEQTDGSASGGTSGGGAGATCMGVEGVVVDGVARLSLEDYCGLFGCPADVEGAAMQFAEFCPFVSPEWPVFVRSGCGVVEVGYNGGYTLGTYVFDEMSGALVGAYQGSDVNGGPCNTHQYAAGAWPVEECADASQCNVCEESGGLQCRYDCDCSQPTGPDPCFGADSCECYCNRLCRSGGECG